MIVPFFVWKLSFNFIQKLFVVKTQNLRVSANNHQLLRFLVQYSVKKCKCISENLFKNSENKVNHRHNRWNMFVYFSLDGRRYITTIVKYICWGSQHDYLVSTQLCVEYHLIAGEAIFCSLSRLSSFFFSSSSDCWFLCNNSSIFRLSNLETYS